MAIQSYSRIGRLYGSAIHGKYKITGTVKTKDDPINVPVSRQVRLHDRLTGVCHLETWADPITGYFEFINIADKKYYVVAHDYTGLYNGLIRTDVSPIEMPVYVPPVIVPPDPDPTDPEFSNVAILFPFSTDLEDIKLNSWTNNGASYSTAQAKWGDGSILFTGDTNPPYSQLVLGNGIHSDLAARDFAVEFWFRPSTMFHSVQRMVACNDQTGNDEMTMYFTDTGAAAISWYHTSAQRVTVSLAAGTVTANNWHYLKFNRNGDLHAFQINGVTGTSTVTHTAPTNANRRWSIGTFWNPFARQPFTGHMQDFRLTLDNGRPGTDIPTEAFLTS